MVCTAKQLEMVRAPKGGIVVRVDGELKLYLGGQFLPRRAEIYVEKQDMAIEITVTSQYGTLSRGRHSARQGNGDSAQWAEKNAKGQIVITEPGTWQLHCSDGFKRTARATLVVEADGNWTMTGDTRRFDVIE